MWGLFNSLLLKPLPQYVSYWLPGIIITGLACRMLFYSIISCLSQSSVKEAEAKVLCLKLNEAIF